MSSSAQPFVSIVVPVFNSASSLNKLCEAVSSELIKAGLTYELLLIDDGSSDASWSQIIELKQVYPNLIGISLTHNVGQHKALLCGISNAGGEWIVTLDDDLQFSPADISNLLAHAKESKAKLVYGIPERKNHQFHRKLGSKFITYVFTHFAGMKREGSPFKLIHKDLASKLILHSHPFLFIDEVLQWYAPKIGYTSVSHSPREIGNSTYTFWKLLRLGLKYIVGYTTFPLRVISFFGLLSFFICLGFIIYFLYMKFNFGAELGFTALIVSIFMSTGAILFSLGVIGEYLNRLFHLQSSKPIYVIKDQL